MIMTDGKNNKLKLGNVVYLYAFIGHGIPSKSGKFIYFVWKLHVLRPIRCKMAAPQSYN